MSFPHRTAFYDLDTEKIVYPGHEKCPLIDSGGGVIRDDNPLTFLEAIPLASTGLEDSEGDEIFEGHILNTKIYRRSESEITVVFYGDGHFICFSDEKGPQDRYDYVEEKVGVERANETEIIAHALTDPELVPDGFDVEEYFGIEGNDDS